MKTPRVRACAGIALLIGSRLWSFAAEPLTLERFEVTAQKRTQPIFQVPVALNAYSGTFLDQAGIGSYQDLAPLAPGLFVQEQSPNNPGINLRGITTDSGDPRTETRVSIFQDGVSISRARGSVVELFDMERVEVLKGPQGTLFGRSAEIGALSLVQNKARNETSAQLATGIGDFSERRASGHANAPLVADRLFGRIAFSYRRHDGTVANLADGSTLNGRDTLALRGGLRWQPAPETTVDLIANWQRDRPPGTAFKSGTIPTSRGDTDPFAPAELNRGARLGLDRTVGGVTALVEHHFDDRWSLHSVTGWREFDAYEAFDGDGSRLYLLELADDTQGRQFSQELRANFEGERFDGFVGAGWFHETGDQRVPLTTDERQLWPWLSGLFRDGLITRGVPAALANAAVPTLNPLQPQATLPLTFAAFNQPALPASLRALAGLAGVPLKSYHEEAYINSATTRSWDVFADGTWRATPWLSLTFGARFTRDDLTSGYEVIDSATPGTLGFITGASPNDGFVTTGGRRREASQTGDGWTGRATAQFALPGKVNAYSGLSRGRRPAALVLDATKITPLHEETVLNYELGVKQPVLGGRGYWQAAVFRYDYAHFQTTLADPQNLGRFITVDAGNATGRGGELSFFGALNEQAVLFATYGYTEATFDETGENGRRQQYAGYTFRLTPRHTASLGTVVTLPLRGHGRLTLTPVWTYRSAHYFSDNNAEFNHGLRQSGYGLFNLRVAWRSPRGRWEIGAHAENLFDKKYLIDAGNAGSDYGTPTFIAGAPRRWGASVAARW